MKTVRPEVLEEREIIRHSGEIPEVAYWNSLYYLEKDPEGPKIKLSPQEKRLLKRAVVERYLVIISRDLNVANVGKSHYRGVKRAIVNWRRLKRFATRECFSREALRQSVLENLRRFLKEAKENGLDLDVGPDELKTFVAELSFSPQIFRQEGLWST